MPRFHQQPKFQPQANVPMAGETRDRHALEIRMAGETLIERPSIDAYNTLSTMFATLERAGMSPVLVQPGSRLMCGICDRFEQAGSITVEAEEARHLRQVIAAIDASLHRIPLQRFDQAVAEVKAFYALVDPSDSEGKNV